MSNLAQDILRDWQEMKQPKVPAKGCYHCKIMKPLSDYPAEGLRSRVCGECVEVRRQKLELTKLGAVHVGISS